MSVDVRDMTVREPLNSETRESPALLDPMWFYRQHHAPVISYLKNAAFARECRDFVDEHDNTVLHYVCMEPGAFPRTTKLLIEWLVQTGLSMNRKNKAGYTPFFYLMRHWFSHEFSDEMGFAHYTELARHADMLAQDARGDTVLHVFCHSPQIERVAAHVRRVIDTVPAVLRTKNRRKQLPLHVALTCWSAGTRDVMYVFAKTPPACYQTCDARGRNIFHVALEYGHSAIVRYMCKQYPLLPPVPLQTSQRTPAAFIPAINGDASALRLCLQHAPALLRQRDAAGRSVADVLAEYYLVTQDAAYRRALEAVADSIDSADVQRVRERMRAYDTHGNYVCHICGDATADVRAWERPFVCRAHPDQKFHMSCLKQWLSVQRCCPMCAYR